MNTPALRELMRGYFHQDWDTYGTEREVVWQFMSDMPSVRDTLVDEVEQLVELEDSDASIARRLDALGNEYVPPPADQGPYRAWMLRVAEASREWSAARTQ